MAQPLSDEERHLLRIFKRYWGDTPPDWRPKDIEDGTSSFLDYRELMQNSDFSMEVLENILAELSSDRTKPPPFYPVKMEYLRRTNKTQQFSAKALAQRRKCESCLGSGLVYIVQDWQGEGPGEKPVIPRLVRDYEWKGKPVINTIPCRCRVGEELNNKVYQYRDEILKRLHKCSLDTYWEAMKHAGYDTITDEDREEVRQFGESFAAIMQKADDALQEEQSLPSAEEKEEPQSKSLPF